MEWSTVVFVLGLIALLAAIVLGGKVAIGKDKIELDTPGFLKWMEKARTEKKQPAPPVVADPATLPKQRIPRARVMWVDDHPANNVYERQALASVGIFADSYTTNGEALKAMRMAPYDLIVSDITRDDGSSSGWDLLEEIRRPHPRIPFFFYVGQADESRRQEAARRGASGITTMPDELLRMVFSAVAAKV